MQSYLDSDEQKRVQKVQEQWNFYEGYHWEDIPNDGDRPQVTENYCADGYAEQKERWAINPPFLFISIY